MNPQLLDGDDPGTQHNRATTGNDINEGVTSMDADCRADEAHDVRSLSDAPSHTQLEVAKHLLTFRSCCDNMTMDAPQGFEELRMDIVVVVHRGVSRNGQQSHQGHDSGLPLVVPNGIRSKDVLGYFMLTRCKTSRLVQAFHSQARQQKQDWVASCHKPVFQDLLEKEPHSVILRGAFDATVFGIAEACRVEDLGYRLHRNSQAAKPGLCQSHCILHHGFASLPDPVRPC